MLTNFIQKWKVSLQEDKLQHFILGILTTLVFLIMSYIFQISLLIGFIVIHIVGYGLELLQSFTKNRQVEANDAFATVSGGALPYLFLALYHLLFG